MAEGFKGLLDFVGYPVGRPPDQVVGFVGLLDFAGYPVGSGEAAPAPGKSRYIGFLANLGLFMNR